MRTGAGISFLGWRWQSPTNGGVPKTTETDCLSCEVRKPPHSGWQGQGLRPWRRSLARTSAQLTEGQLLPVTLSACALSAHPSLRPHFPFS